MGEKAYSVDIALIRAFAHLRFPCAGEKYNRTAANRQGNMQSDEKSIRILILEDHEITLDGLCHSLGGQSDFEIVGRAVDSDTGMQLAKELRPDVILLDLHMPGSLGPKSMVEAFCALQETKIVIFSSEKRSAFVDAVTQLGVAAYLLKSEPAVRVADCIRQIVQAKETIVSGDISSPLQRLTETELSLLEMFAHGMKYQDIANKRHTSPSTVRKQCETLLEKLGLASREELISWAATRGYGSLDSH